MGRQSERASEVLTPPCKLLFTVSENALEVATDFTGELHRHRGHESTMAAAMGTQVKASCTRRGWLDKKPSSGLGGSWKRRWVVLTQNSAEAKISWYAGVRRAALARGARRIALGFTMQACMRPRDSRLTTQAAHGARMHALRLTCGPCQHLPLTGMLLPERRGLGLPAQSQGRVQAARLQAEAAWAGRRQDLAVRHGQDGHRRLYHHGRQGEPLCRKHGRCGRPALPNRLVGVEAGSRLGGRSLGHSLGRGMLRR